MPGGVREASGEVRAQTPRLTFPHTTNKFASKLMSFFFGLPKARDRFGCHLGDPHGCHQTGGRRALGRLLSGHGGSLGWEPFDMDCLVRDLKLILPYMALLRALYSLIEPLKGLI